MASSANTDDKRGATPGQASMGMRTPSGPPAHPDTHSSRYPDDPREKQWEEDRAHLRHFERRRVNQPSASGMGPRSYVRSEARIRDDIADTLTDHHEIDATDIEFEVSGDTVTLGGYVPDRRMRFMAEDIVSRVRGVREVVNNIRVQTWHGELGRR